jgi:hypothetical protein
MTIQAPIIVNMKRHSCVALLLSMNLMVFAWTDPSLGIVFTTFLGTLP